MNLREHRALSNKNKKTSLLGCASWVFFYVEKLRVVFTLGFSYHREPVFLKPSFHMDILTPLHWRYATKKFDPNKKINESTFEKLLDALVLTPSSYGLQPWKFLVVTDPKIRARLRVHSWDQAQVTDSSHFVVLCRLENMTAAHVDHYVERIMDVRGVSRESLEGYKSMMMAKVSDSSATKEWMKNQVYITLGNLMTSAAALGVDACPMEGFDPAEYDRILDLPAQGLRACLACPLGYRSEDDHYAEVEKVRFPKEEVVVRA